VYYYELPVPFLTEILVPLAKANPMFNYFHFNVLLIEFVEPNLARGSSSFGSPILTLKTPIMLVYKKQIRQLSMSL